MDWLKDKIEKQLKNKDKSWGWGDALNWVLSELEKMTCENCKLKDHCSSCLIQQYGDIKITLCSGWEGK